MSTRAEQTALRLAIRAAGFPPATRRHALERVAQALLVYREVPASEPTGRGRPRDTRLESLLINLAVQFHIAKPETPGVTKRGERYSGALVDFAREVLSIVGARVTARNFGRLIYSVVRKEAQIHGDLDRYPTISKRSRVDWTLASDVPVTLESMLRYSNVRKRRS
jgi:hypothetical protein